jgi:hypothetical protein
MTVATACVTVGDYVQERRRGPESGLGAWLATVYLGSISLLVTQVLVTGYVTRRFSVTTAFSVLPVLLVLGAPAALDRGCRRTVFIKGADGSLLFAPQNASEMLFSRCLTPLGNG